MERLNFIFANYEKLSVADLRASAKPQLSPTTGAETHYDDSRWNSENIMGTHNCYDYALNRLDPHNTSKTQPGDLSAGRNFELFRRPYKCSELDKKIIADNPTLYYVRYDEPCRDGYRKIVMFVSETGDDYHFLRQDKNGLWSHKVGELQVFNRDQSGRPIEDPRFANLATDYRDYTEFCGAYCLIGEAPNV